MRHGFSRRTIKRNHLCEQPSRVVYIDCETLPVERKGVAATHDHVYRLSVTRYCRRDRGQWRVVEDKQWTERNQMWSYIFNLATRRGVLWVIAHNAVFDLTVSGFWAYLDGGELILRGDLKYHTGQSEEYKSDGKDWQGLFVVDDKRCIIQACHPKGRINVIDSMNYFRQSLSALGESIGLPKMPMPAFDADDEQWFTYCTNDVRILQQSVTQLMERWKDHDNGNWQPTAASLAWSNYRHKFLDDQITTHDDKVATKLERDAHMGGECRCWFVGDVLDDYSYNVWDFMGRLNDGRPKLKGPCVLYDVRSLYPYVMANTLMPTRLVHSQKAIQLDKLKLAHDKYWCIARVDVTTNIDEFPCRVKTHNAPSWQDRLLFPVGTFRTVLCGEELALAIRSNRVTAAYEIAMYDCDMLFGDYVSHWYNQKIESETVGNKVERELCKIMLNSLYGRFAMGRKRYVLDDSAPCVQPWGHWVHKDMDTGVITKRRGVGGNVLSEMEVDPTDHQLSAIAAAITSAGRSFMRNARASMPSRSVLYQDTDSLLVMGEHCERFETIHDVVSGDVGRFKRSAEFSQTEIWGPKNYTVDGVNKIAGCPRQSVKTGHRTYKGEIFESGDSIMSRPCPDSVSVVIRTADFSGQHGGDIPTDSGWTIPVSITYERSVA